MTSEIVNRAVPSDGFRFSNHLVAKALHLTNNGRDKLSKLVVDRARSDHSQVDGIRHEAEQRHRGRVAVDKTRGVKQIGNPNLVGREAIPHRVHDIFSIEPDQGSRRSFCAHGIDEDYFIGISEQIEKRQSKRAALGESDARRDAIVALYQGDRRRAKAIIAEQNITQPENKNTSALGRWRGFAAHAPPSFRLGQNLWPLNIESISPEFSINDQRTTE